MVRYLFLPYFIILGTERRWSTERHHYSYGGHRQHFAQALPSVTEQEQKQAMGKNENSFYCRNAVSEAHARAHRTQTG